MFSKKKNRAAPCVGVSIGIERLFAIVKRKTEEKNAIKTSFSDIRENPCDVLTYSNIHTTNIYLYIIHFGTIPQQHTTTLFLNQFNLQLPIIYLNPRQQINFFGVHNSKKQQPKQCPIQRTKI